MLASRGNYRIEIAVVVAKDRLAEVKVFAERVPKRQRNAQTGASKVEISKRSWELSYLPVLKSFSR